MKTYLSILSFSRDFGGDNTWVIIVHPSAMLLPVQVASASAALGTHFVSEQQTWQGGEGGEKKANSTKSRQEWKLLQGMHYTERWGGISVAFVLHLM